VRSFAEAARAADILMILIPDELQPAILEEHIWPNVNPGDVLCFASGYNIHFRTIKPPENCDVILVAPRMIGDAVRSLFKEGKGYPCLVGACRDKSGSAMAIALAIAKAIGATRLGAFDSSFEEEATIDLFAEQMLWPGIIRLCELYFEKLVGVGCDPEVVATELHLSGEFVEIAKAMITEGFFKQLRLHSQTSQYGQLSRTDRLSSPVMLAEVDRILEEIRSGDFEREWTAEQKNGKPTLERLLLNTQHHPLQRAENNLEELRKMVAESLKG
jgi:ketol-acid reductoisomerase